MFLILVNPSFAIIGSDWRSNTCDSWGKASRELMTLLFLISSSMIVFASSDVRPWDGELGRVATTTLYVGNWGPQSERTSSSGNHRQQNKEDSKPHISRQISSAGLLTASVAYRQLSVSCYCIILSPSVLGTEVSLPSMLPSDSSLLRSCCHFELVTCPAQSSCSLPSNSRASAFLVYLGPPSNLDCSSFFSQGEFSND